MSSINWYRVRYGVKRGLGMLCLLAATVSASIGLIFLVHYLAVYVFYSHATSDMGLAVLMSMTTVATFVASIVAGVIAYKDSAPLDMLEMSQHIPLHSAPETDAT